MDRHQLPHAYERGPHLMLRAAPYQQVSAAAHVATQCAKRVAVVVVVVLPLPLHHRLVPGGMLWLKGCGVHRVMHSAQPQALRQQRRRRRRLICETAGRAAGLQFLCQLSQLPQQLLTSERVARAVLLAKLEGAHCPLQPLKLLPLPRALLAARLLASGALQHKHKVQARLWPMPLQVRDGVGMRCGQGVRCGLAHRV